MLSTNLLTLRVYRAVSLVPLKHPTGYRAEVLRSLGLFSPPMIERDQALMADLDAQQNRYRSLRRLKASYALLTEAESHDSNDTNGGASWTATNSTDALWRGRDLWHQQDEAGAATQWRAAFGVHPVNRRRLVDAMYLAGRYYLAIDEATAILKLEGCSTECRTQTLSQLRYWLTWQGSSDTIVRTLCNRIIDGLPPGWQTLAGYEDVANIIARRALTAAADSQDFLQDLNQAEEIQRTPYVEAVRALLEFRQNRTSDALLRARSVIQMPLADAQALILAGEILLSAGDREGAIAAWNIAEHRDELFADIAKGLVKTARAEQQSPNP